MEDWKERTLYLPWSLKFGTKLRDEKWLTWCDEASELELGVMTAEVATLAFGCDKAMTWLKRSWEIILHWS